MTRRQAQVGGELIARLWSLQPRWKVRLDIVKRPEGLKGFQVLPKQWMVEWASIAERLSVFDSDERDHDPRCTGPAHGPSLYRST